LATIYNWTGTIHEFSRVHAVGKVMECNSKEVRLFEPLYQCATCISIICQSWQAYYWKFCNIFRFVFTELTPNSHLKGISNYDV